MHRAKVEQPEILARHSTPDHVNQARAIWQETSPLAVPLCFYFRQLCSRTVWMHCEKRCQREHLGARIHNQVPAWRPRTAKASASTDDVLILHRLQDRCRTGNHVVAIEFEKGRFQLRIEGSQTKNEEPILLPLPFELNQVLKKMSRQGQVFEATNLRKSFQAACVKVGLGVKTGPNAWQYKGLLIHDLRRSGVRNLIRSGVPRRIAMKISGHLTESTFERYNIVDSTDLHEAMKKVEKHFDGSLMAVRSRRGRAGR